MSSAVMALVPAAGRGERLGAAVPKAFVPVAGAPLVVHAVRGLLAAGCVDSVVVAVPESVPDDVLAPLHALGAHTVPGGAERTDSVRAMLAHADADVLLVHDAARAFTPADVVTRVVAAVRAGHRAVIPVLPVPDTVKQVDADGVVTGTPDRAALRVVQTPQGFDAATLRAAYRAFGGATTDDAGLVERLGEPVHTVAGHPHAMKITTPHDLAVAELVLAGLGAS